MSLIVGLCYFSRCTESLYPVKITVFLFIIERLPLPYFVLLLEIKEIWVLSSIARLLSPMVVVYYQLHKVSAQLASLVPKRDNPARQPPWISNLSFRQEHQRSIQKFKARSFLIFPHPFVSHAQLSISQALKR